MERCEEAVGRIIATSFWVWLEMWRVSLGGNSGAVNRGQFHEQRPDYRAGHG